MSTKSMRLVLEERESLKSKNKIEDREESSEGEENTGYKKNLFELLNQESDNESAEELNIIEKVSIKKSKKRNKKKKINKEKTCTAEKGDADNEDIDSIIKEFNELPSCSSSKAVVQNACRVKSCFTVELRNLNPDSEVKRLFGNRILLNENKQNKREQKVKKYQLITPKLHIEVVLRKSGLSMDVVKREAGCIEFVFVHSRSYQETQRTFLQAVKTNNHHKLIYLLERYPFHVDGLQQMSNMYRMQEDMQQAAESIENALYVFEASFHPLFSLTMGTSRLDYRRNENRAFFLTLFRHITFLSNKSLHTTALEVAKLILSLSPDTDPLGILLFLDHLCHKSHQYTFLTLLYQEWKSPKNLFQLPNFAFSVPLAYYLLSSSSSSSSTSSSSNALKNSKEVCKEKMLEKADEMLTDALMMYPCMLVRLLEKLDVRADKQVLSHHHFKQDFHAQPKALSMLMDLYIWRSHELWKATDVVEWVERVVRGVVDGWEGYKDTVEFYRKLRLCRYKGTPRNIYRHIVISEARAVVTDFPSFLMNSIESFDPLPPADSIQAYDVTLNGGRNSINESRNFLSLFFQSLSPAYNNNAVVSDDEEREEGVAIVRRDWMGGLVGGVRELFYNRFHNDHPGDDVAEDEAGGNNDDEDVPRRQDWSDDGDNEDGNVIGRDGNRESVGRITDESGGGVNGGVGNGDVDGGSGSSSHDAGVSSSGNDTGLRRRVVDKDGN